MWENYFPIYGGGGHQGAGSCRVPVKDAEEVLNKLSKP